VSERYLDETHIVSIRCEVSLYMFGLCMVNRSLFVLFLRRVRLVSLFYV
jgi:hypothetical protein